MRLLVSLLRRLRDRGAWLRSGYSDLPQLHASAAPFVNHYCVIAGGLALILSRAPRRDLACRFLATQELHELLRRQLREHGRAKPSAQLINEVMQEVATLADPTTRAALKACVQMRSQVEARKREKGTTTSALPDEQDSSEGAATVLSMELFDDRAEALRATVAKAKGRPPARDTSPS